MMDHIPTDPAGCHDLIMAHSRVRALTNQIADLQARFDDLEERHLCLLDEHNRVLEILTEDQLAEMNL